MNSPEIKVLFTDAADTTIALPSYETDGAAGADVRANLAPQDRAGGLDLAHGARLLVPTGLRLEIPPGFEVQVRPRSGLALKYGVTLANTPGTIDSDYRGPLGVILLNTGQDKFTVTHGERIAQLIVAPVVQGRFGLTHTLKDSQRGTGGFGSTGRG